MKIQINNTFMCIFTYVMIFYFYFVKLISYKSGHCVYRTHLPEENEKQLLQQKKRRREILRFS